MPPRRAIVITFGRFNPPTTGHAALVKFVQSVAARAGADVRLFPSASQDPAKNPLPFAEKVRFLKMLFPQVSVNDNSSIRTPFDALRQCAAAGYTDVIVVVGSDRVADFEKFQRYILPKTSPKYRADTHVALASYRVVPVPGIRDEDESGTSGMSASKQRAFAAVGDYETFKQGVPTQNDRVARMLYSAVRQHMQIKESDRLYYRIQTTVTEDVRDTFRIPLDEAVSNAGRTWSYGSLEVIDDGRPQNKTVQISYAGNMGATERINVRTSFDKIFGVGKFDAVRPYGKFAFDKRNTYSDPSYQYILLVPRDRFYGVIGTAASQKARVHEAAPTVTEDVRDTFRIPLDEASPFYDSGGAFTNASKKALSNYGRFTEKQAAKLVKAANSFSDKARREYALRCADEIKSLGPKSFKGPSSLDKVKVPAGLPNTVVSHVKKYMSDATEDALQEATTYAAPKPPSEVDRLKVRQKQDDITLKQRHANELMAAKLRDVQQKAREQQQKASAPKPASR